MKDLAREVSVEALLRWVGKLGEEAEDIVSASEEEVVEVVVVVEAEGEEEAEEVVIAVEVEGEEEAREALVPQ